MDLWFLSTPEVLSREREAFNTLKSNKDWLVGLEWVLEDQQLCVYAVINVSNNEYKAKLIYPKHFPDAPPIVLPIEPKRRWSTHQYGENGSLCLEWGPDNWISTVTGADLICSAYKLLETENPLELQPDQNERPVAPSRHYLEPGQELRGQYSRCLVTKALLEYINKVRDLNVQSIKFSLNWFPDSLIVMVHRVIADDLKDLWVDPLIPANLHGRNDNKDLYEGLLLSHASFTESILKDISDFNKLMQVIKSAGFDQGILTDKLKQLCDQKKVAGICLSGTDNIVKFYLTFDCDKIYSFYSLLEDNDFSGNAINEANFRNKKVCIIGLGSVGSKIADTLARSGVKKFHLIDYDIFLPHNIKRHSLNWEDVGEHKTKVIKRLIKKISRDVEIDISDINLTGQESTLNLDSCLKKIAQCDLIIDATANERVFNLISSIVKQEKKPFLWVGVFEGGKGGVIGRYLPEKDPFPEIIRASYNQFCVENPFPESKTIGKYVLEDHEGKVIVASDADVSVIANSAAHLAVDLLSGSFGYKHQVYLIGLGAWWIFKEPLEVIPIDCHHLRQSSSVDKKEFSEDDKKFLEALIESDKKK